eukprot:gene6875-7092_t
MYSDAAVSRMMNGQPFDVAPYYAAAHPATVRRLTAGLPVQVYCCWNGLVKLRAEPFTKGLRFRKHQPGECRGSPYNLLCDDLHRLNYSRALVDSGILVTHQYELSNKISRGVQHSKRMPYIRRSSWVEVQGGGSPWHMSREELRSHTYPQVTCCDGSSDMARNGTAPDALQWSSGAAAAVIEQVAGVASGQHSAPGARAEAELAAAVAGEGRSVINMQPSSSAAGEGLQDSAAGNQMSMEAWLTAASLPTVQPLLGMGGGRCRPIDIMSRNFTREFLLSTVQSK